MATAPKPIASVEHLKPGLSLFDSVTLVAGSMIGSGIFIVSADITRQVHFRVLNHIKRLAEHDAQNARDASADFVPSGMVERRSP